MEELRGMPVVKAMAEDMKKEIEGLKERGILPKLVVVRVGAREDDLSYERGIIKRFEAVNAAYEIKALDENISQEGFDKVIEELNSNELVHGILVFRPLPKHLSDDRLCRMINPDKDVDCIHMANYAKVFAGTKDAFAPCTPKAVMEMLDFYKVDLTGKKVVVVGRSMVVGKPLAMLLLSKNATVTVCHTKTRNLEEECKAADIIVACAGCANMIKKEHVRTGQIVIDVGINFAEGKMCGDVDYEGVSEVVDAVTPVPGGVGTVTTSVLLKHTVMSAGKR